jgi:NAD(P)-dependent dehydrogenase (short-subunit alcohol dehydrogenase family)
MSGKRHARVKHGSVLDFAVVRHMRSMMTVLAGTLAFACSEPPLVAPLPVELILGISAPGEVDPSATVYLSVYHAWTGEGELRHPLEFIESVETKLGTSTITFNYPPEGGEGLVVYAWVDTDGDAIHCTPAGRRDLADLAEVGEFPSEQVSVSLFLEVPCAGPEWFFPGPVPKQVQQQPGYVPTVLITGSNRGLGLEFTRQYAEAGWKVIATARRPDAAEELQALAEAHPKLVIEQLDVTDFDMIEALATKYRNQPIDVLLNNAGIAGDPSPQQVFLKFDYELFDPFIQTNAVGPAKISEAFLSNLEISERKTIAAISSTAGSFTELDAGASPGTTFYRVSKAALNMFMVEIAAALEKRGVTVVLLNPGMVDTRGGILVEMNEKMNLGLTITPIEESISGMIEIIASMSLEDSGKMYQYSGEPMGF